jgi:hypothetical protein
MVELAAGDPDRLVGLLRDEDQNYSSKASCIKLRQVPRNTVPSNMVIFVLPSISEFVRTTTDGSARLTQRFVGEVGLDLGRLQAIED